MRTLFWILLLGNAILFALMQRGGWSWGEQPYQAQPALNEEKIRLLDASPQNATRSATQSGPQGELRNEPQSEPGKMLSAAQADEEKYWQERPPTLRMDMRMSDPVPVAKPQPAPLPVAKAQAIPAPRPERAAEAVKAVEAVPAEVKQDVPVCLEWGDFSGSDLKRAANLLSGLKLGGKLSRRQIEYKKGYWVFIPPLKNKAAVDQKISQLKARGVHEYFVVQEEGALRNAISLGIFKTEEAAQNYHKVLRAKDVRTAKVGERASKLKTTMFMLSGVDAITEARLASAKKGFAGSELKKVPCALTK